MKISALIASCSWRHEPDLPIGHLGRAMRQHADREYGSQKEAADEHDERVLEAVGEGVPGHAPAWQRVPRGRHATRHRS